MFMVLNRFLEIVDEMSLFLCVCRAVVSVVGLFD